MTTMYGHYTAGFWWAIKSRLLTNYCLLTRLCPLRGHCKATIYGLLIEVSVSSQLVLWPFSGYIMAKSSPFIVAV